ncbi:hypothetical protein [Pseudoxanthomonas beigongshangi]|jgi:hypothetical protein
MTDDRFRFELHDDSRFPFVRATPRERQAGVAPQWQREMEALIGRAQPFVIIFPPGHHADLEQLDGDAMRQAQEERKQRALWLKRNRDLLAESCKGMITIELDAARRSAERARATQLEKAFGVPLRVADSGDMADELADALLERR